MIFGKLKGLMVFLQGILMAATFSIAYAYFAKMVGQPLSFEIPQLLYPIVGIGVVGVSIVTALFHIIGGGIMGATAGGVLMGMKMGLFLGLAYAFGRLWLYVGSAFAASAIFWSDLSWWKVVGLGVAAAICLAIQKITLFVWGKVDSQ